MAHVVNQAPVDWFETIASAVTDQMAYIDRDGVYRAANRAYIAATASRVGRPDLSVADLVGRRLEEILPPGLVATVLRPCLARCVAGHAVTLQRWFDIGGERRYLSVSYHPHRAGERVLGMVVVIRDRTLERQTQLLLREIGNSVALLSGDVEAVAEELVTVAAER
ncbi:MAG: PAS domain-containing protein, partial [Acidobacteriota bacterium]